MQSSSTSEAVNKITQQPKQPKQQDTGNNNIHYQDRHASGDADDDPRPVPLVRPNGTPIRPFCPGYDGGPCGKSGRLGRDAGTGGPNGPYAPLYGAKDAAVANVGIVGVRDNGVCVCECVCDGCRTAVYVLPLLLPGDEFVPAPSVRDFFQIGSVGEIISLSAAFLFLAKGISGA